MEETYPKNDEGQREPRACREKYWSELTDAEKIERCRQVIHGLQNEVRFLSSRLETLEDHAHIDGKIYTRRQGYGFAAEGPRIKNPKDDEVFF